MQKNIILNQDCLKYMQELENESIDLIVADPPYFQVKGKFDFIWNDEQEYLDWILKCLFEFNRILKPNGTLMLWGGLGKGKLTLCKIAIMIEELPKPPSEMVDVGKGHGLL